MKDNTTGAFVLKNLKVIIGSQKESGSRVEVQIEELTLHNNMGVEMDKGEFDSYVGFARDLVQTTGVILNAVMDKKHTQRLETLKTQAELGVDCMGRTVEPKKASSELQQQFRTPRPNGKPVYGKGPTVIKPGRSYYLCGRRY